MKIAIHAHIHTPSKRHKCPDQRVETHCNGFLPPSESPTIALHRMSHHVGGVSPLAMRGMPAIRLRRAAVLIFTHSVTSDTTNATAAATRAVCVRACQACVRAHTHTPDPISLWGCASRARRCDKQIAPLARARARLACVTHVITFGLGCMHASVCALRRPSPSQQTSGPNNQLPLGC